MERKLVALLLAAAALPAAPAAAQEEMEDVRIGVEQVRPGVAVLFGRGGNIGVSHGPEGNILIDDQYAPLTSKILGALATLNGAPVRFVINTHWHGDHVGGNENLGERGAVIVAHDNVRTRLSTEQFMERFGRIPPSPPEALPVVTFDEGVTLHVNGDTLEIVHMPAAHTDGDSIIRWREANVVHMGDLFFHRFSLPFIDLDSGGSLDGLIAGVERALGMTDAATVVIPGHGPVARRADLAAYRDMIVNIRNRVQAAIAAGRSLEQVQAMKPAAGYGLDDGFISPDDFVATVYRELAGR
ncbi:MAG: MBL fold metallo-hydrolase [Sphingomonadaceae bacterium]